MTLDEIIQADKEESRFSVDTYPGIAFYFLKEETVIEGHDWCYEDEVPTGNAIMVMVGDDRKHSIDPDYVHKLSDDEYCTVCGQIGCNHNF